MNSRELQNPYTRQDSMLQKITAERNDLADLALLMFRKTVEYTNKADEKLRDEVVDQLENKMNMDEDSLELSCIQFLATEKPVVKTLRTIVMIIKMNSEFERVADLSKGIVLSAERYYKGLGENSGKFLSPLTELTQSVIEKTIDCLKNKEIGKAHSIRTMDQNINTLRLKIVTDCLKRLKIAPEENLAGHEILVMSQKLERIGDLCKNLAEEMIYIESGDMNKHL